MPLKPKIPVTIETAKKINAHLNICVHPNVMGKFISTANVPCGFLGAGRQIIRISVLREKNFGCETGEKEKSRVAV